MSGKLSWSYYCELLSIFDENKHSFYEKGNYKLEFVEVDILIHHMNLHSEPYYAI